MCSLISGGLNASGLQCYPSSYSSLISGLPVSHPYTNSSSATLTITGSPLTQLLLPAYTIAASNIPSSLPVHVPFYHELAGLLTPDATDTKSSTASDSSRNSEQDPTPASPLSTTSVEKTPPPRSAQLTVQSPPRNPVQTASSAAADIPYTNPSVSREPHTELSAFGGPSVQPGPSGTTRQQVRTSPSGTVVVNGVTIAPGQRQTISGSTILIESDHLIINSKTLGIAYPPNAASAKILASHPPPTFDGVTLRPNNGGTVILGDLTIGPGQHTAIQGISMSIGVDSVVVDSSTNDMPTATPIGNESAPSALATLAGPTPVSMSSNGAIVAGHTILPQGSPKFFGGTPVSVGSNIVVIGSSTYAPPKIPTLSIASNGATVLGHDTLSDGEVTTLSGKVVSVGSSNVVLDGTAMPFLDMPMSLAASNGAIVLGHTTPSTGEATTLSGKVVSVGSSNVIVDGTTFPLPTRISAPGSEPTSSAVLGPIIASMLGYTPLPRPSDASNSNVEASPTPISVSVTSTPISNLTLFTGAQSKVTAGKSISVITSILWVSVGSFALAL